VGKSQVEDGNFERPMPSEARDFHELYLIEAEPELIQAFWVLRDSPGKQREDKQAVQRVRERIHELNTATISLYITAIYLAYAQRVSQELQLGQLHASPRRRQVLMDLLDDVRQQLGGSHGIIEDLQDLIGSSLWKADDTTLTYYEFRE